MIRITFFKLNDFAIINKSFMTIVNLQSQFINFNFLSGIATRVIRAIRVIC